MLHQLCFPGSVLSESFKLHIPKRDSSGVSRGNNDEIRRRLSGFFSPGRIVRPDDRGVAVRLRAGRGQGVRGPPSAAGEGSDFVVVTSDNPRSEDPNAIIAEILPGLAATQTPYIVEPDRARAIALALQQAAPGDVVLIAGKGHEKEQILRSGPIFFDDAQVALSALRALSYRGER